MNSSLFGCVLCLLALPALAGAETIVQTGLFSEAPGSFHAFNLKGYTLASVEAQFALDSTWGGIWSADFVPGEGLANLYTTGHAELSFLGTTLIGTENSCSLRLRWPGSGWFGCSQWDWWSWFSDGSNPEWYGNHDFLIYPSLFAMASCDSCTAQVDSMSTRGNYTVTYTYDVDSNNPPVAEPGSALLVVFPLAAGAFAMRWRRN